MSFEIKQVRITMFNCDTIDPATLAIEEGLKESVECTKSDSFRFTTSVDEFKSGGFRCATNQGKRRGSNNSSNHFTKAFNQQHYSPNTANARSMRTLRANTNSINGASNRKL